MSDNIKTLGPDIFLLKNRYHKGFKNLPINDNKSPI